MARDGSETRKQVFEIIRDASPAVSVAEIADELGTARNTVRPHLQALLQRPNVKKREIGQTPVYWYDEEPDLGVSDPNIEVGFSPGKVSVSERVQGQMDSVTEWATDLFVGLDAHPDTAVHPNDGRAEAGDRIQMRVDGIPGSWNHPHQRWHWDDRREDLVEEETTMDEVNVLVSGTLYAKPTTPIEHVEYPDDYDLEGRKTMSPWLFEPCNEAVFLTDVEIDWISPLGFPRPEVEVLGGGEDNE